MKARKRMEEFEPGCGYTKEDWDTVDSPELTDEELASMRPATEVLPPEFFKALSKRPKQKGVDKDLHCRSALQ